MAYRVFKALLSPILRVVFRIRAEGVENLPAHGPVILASNHRSFCDSIFLPLVVPRRVTFVAKAEYFEHARTAWFFRLMGQIPVTRGGGPVSARALDAAEQVLRSGGVFGIYPEGTRSPDGRLYKGRTGVARLALATGAPVCPVGMIGTAEAQPIGTRVPRLFTRITIRIGPPRRHDRPGPQPATTLRQITDDVMFEIAELSGQTYVDRYAPSKSGTAIEQPVDDRPAVTVRRGATGDAPAPAFVRVGVGAGAGVGVG